MAPPAKHEYRPPKPSYLTKHIVFPFYDFIVQFYPYCWTPNGITLFGIFCTTLASVLLFTSMPNTTEFTAVKTEEGSRILHVLEPLTNPSTQDRGSIPAYPLAAENMRSSFLLPSWWAAEWTLLLAGVLNLAYCIADNTDGRQARRTKRSTFIGEYLDHGLDCVTSLMSTFLLVIALGASLPVAAVAVLVVATNTVLSHTINHELGVMIWGNDFVTVDEAMLAFGFGMWIPVFFPGVSSVTVPEWLSFGYLPAGLKAIDVLFVVFVVAQLQVMWTMIDMRRSIVQRAATWFMLFNCIIFFYLIPHPSYRRGTLAKSHFFGVECIEAVLSYPAIWAITAACTCSMICHIPIVAKCAGIIRPELGPLAPVIIVWLVFWGNPVYGLVAAVLFHVAQILFNVQYVQTNKETAAAIASASK